MTAWTDSFLDPWREVGDALADDAVAALLDDRGGARAAELLHALVRDDQPDPAGLPRTVREYLDASFDLPPWADLDRIRRAQRFFQLWGVPISVCLFCASLPSSYAAAKGVKVLYLTARLDTDARRRVMETGQLLMDVLAPGGLGPKGRGRRTIQRVRLMHAAVRHLIVQRAAATPGLWDPAWGLPINQEDLAGTLLAFSYVVGGPLPRLGVEVTAEDADAYVHTWNVVGHLLGVRPELLTQDPADAGRLVAAIRRRQFAASPEGKEMTAALLALLDEMAVSHRASGYVPALVRHLIGDEAADLVDVPRGAPPDGALARLAGRTLRDVATHVEDSRLLQHLAEPFGREVLHGLFRLERGGTRAPFSIPTTLARSWELTPPC